jgi:hypothetical protein
MHNVRIYMTSIILMVRNRFLRLPTFTLILGLCVSSQEALKAKLGTISKEAQNKLEEDTAKKEAKADAKADAARKKKLVRSPSLYQSNLSNHYEGLSSRSPFLCSYSLSPHF